MQKQIVSFVLVAVVMLSALGCTNMNKTQQGGVTGLVGGAAVGAGIGALSGGSAGTGALIGGALGGVAGSIFGHNEETRSHRK